MFESLDLFRTSAAMARHAGARQATVATNVANADTPGYRARAVAPFADALRNTSITNLRMTRPGHIQPPGMGVIAAPRDAGGEPSPNGNTVSIETEMLHAIEAEREHSRALAIYRHGLTVLRTSLGR